LGAEFLPDVLLGALRELTDLPDRARHVLDDLGELVRAEHEHSEDDDRHQLERAYVIEHLKLLAMPSVRGPRWSSWSSVVRAASTVPGRPRRPVPSRRARGVRTPGHGVVSRRRSRAPGTPSAPRRSAPG